MSNPSRADRAYATVLRLKEPGAARLARETDNAHKAAGEAYDRDVRPALTALIEAKRSGAGIEAAAAALAMCGARHRQACEAHDRLLDDHGAYCATLIGAADTAYNRAL